MIVSFYSGTVQLLEKTSDNSGDIDEIVSLQSITDESTLPAFNCIIPIGEALLLCVKTKLSYIDIFIYRYCIVTLLNSSILYTAKLCCSLLSLSLTTKCVRSMSRAIYSSTQSIPATSTRSVIVFPSRGTYLSFTK